MIFLKETNKSPSPVFLFSLSVIFFGFSIIGILNHELWLDEMHHWLLGKDSASLIDLWKNTRYEGHPILWNLFLYYLSRFTSNPLWMQLLHISITTAAVVVFLLFSPFSKTFKTIFIFGYFPLYEYNVLSRNYSVGVLLLFICCSLYHQRKAHYVLLSIFLSLAANTSTLR